MSMKSPVRWLSHRAAVGVKDLPSNTAWLVGKTLPRPVHHVAEGVKDTARRATASAQDVLPGGDSLDTRIKRAREATERARRIEEEALAEATKAKQLADEAKATAEDGRTRLRRVKSESADQVKRRVAEARRRADDEVEQERQRGQSDADDAVRGVSDDVDQRVEESRERAQQAQQSAEAKVAEAAEQMAEARRLADEAAREAQEAAAEARRQADALVADAQRQAAAVDDRQAEARDVQHQAAGVAAEVVTGLRTPQTNGNLKAMTKNELTDLAVTLGVNGPKSMTKQQLVTAVNRESRKSR